MKPVLTGTVGLGGYGGTYLSMFAENEASSDPTLKLTAAMSSNPAKHAEVVGKLQKQGVKICETYEQLLSEPVEAVWLPLPIEMHRPYTEMALAAGKAVMCEKPVAGCVDDLDAMIAARDKAKLPVAIGYQDVYDPTTVPAKRRLLEGAIGQVQSASVWACWPRDSSYYSRNNWAGALKRGDAWVMDSPANNALAHYINITLFLMGSTMELGATPQDIEAELYRVNDIENFDTCSLRLTLPDGVKINVQYTHACEENTNPFIEIKGSKGFLRRSYEEVLISSGGKEEKLPRSIAAMMSSLPRRFSQYVRGVANPDIAVSTLESARPQLVTINGASEATAVRQLSADQWTTKAQPTGATLRRIPGIEDAIRHCIRDGKLLHETKLFTWTRPAGHKDLRGYRHFAGPKMSD
ncbi:MAG: Gfo/Idh/MocA family oxidoreductase [Phycisphaeraceae bacterium]|nr:Gfo/Idh/MocA family oxidoreductase [Phycisphaeraceae bacterium]